MKKFLIYLIAIAILIPVSTFAWDNRGREKERIEQEYPHEYMGKRYKYDLFNPGDQLRYDMDLPLQMREEINLPDQMRREIDPWGGRFRGPMEDWEIDP